MYLSKFRLFNYKSFQDSEVLEFKPGINIIVGANNSGKTALVEGLSLNFQSNIYKGLMKLPYSPDLINSSGYELSLKVKKQTILNFIESIYESGKTTLIPLPDKYTKNNKKSLPTIPEIRNMENIESIENIEFQMRFISPDLIPFDTILNLFSSSYNIPIEKISRKKFSLYHVLNNTQYFGINNINDGGRGKSGSFSETIQYQIFEQYCLSIYKFDAERRSSGTYKTGTSRFLNSDASNLAEVLFNLQGNDPNLFEDFNEYVSMVIPTIKRISVSYYDDTVQIKVWTLERVRQREDLAYPLADCGSGVSQVLAILYVVITSKASQVIIIDEPQSFLHPGAAKKLIEILKIFPQHQYFIATHSAEIIAAANPSTIVKLRYEDGETKTSIMNAEDIIEQSCLLAELGVSLSDVFGADRILWVEGPTEEQCFPLILSKLAPKVLTGTKIISIKNTDDLVGGKTQFAEVMFDLYGRLSGGNNLSPPVLGFVFDRENRTKQNRADLEKRKPGEVHFLERCMYENYLLHPEAIADVLNQEENLEREHVFTSEEVQKELEISKVELKNKKNSFSKDTTPEHLLDSEYVDKNINAAKLLEMVFAKLSLGRLEFKKTKHSFRLTKWLLENSPDDFAEIVQLVQDILNKNKAIMP